LRTAITINGQPVTIPATWAELTFGQALALESATTDAEILAAVSGLPLDTCQSIRPELMPAILWPINELGEVPQSGEWTLTMPRPRPLGSMEFARKVNVDALSRTDADPTEVMGRTVAIYCAEGIEDEDIEACYARLMDEPFPSVADAARYLSGQLAELVKAEAAIKSPEYDAEEWQAGIDDFKKYGTFGLVRSIALRHHCTDEDVYRWSYNKVVLELQYAADENAYQRKLNRILSRKKTQ
jgi:hypothetical protein